MDKLPWYKSGTLRGLLVAGLTLIAQKLGIAETVGDADAAKLVDLALGLVEGAAIAYAAYARTTKPSPPVTETAVRKEAARWSGANPPPDLRQE